MGLGCETFPIKEAIACTDKTGILMVDIVDQDPGAQLLQILEFQAETTKEKLHILRQG